MFTIVNGIQIDLEDYIEDKNLAKQLEKDEPFISAVSFGFEKEFSYADEKIDGDEILNMVIHKEVEKRISKMNEEKFMTAEKMKQIIMEEVPFSTLLKNQGIYEFYEQGDNSLGISYEDICYEDVDEEKDVYIYNIFVGKEYINICGHGTKENPLPDDVLKELVKNWNDLAYSEEIRNVMELVSKGLDAGFVKVEIEDAAMNEIKVSIGEHWFWTYVDYLDNQTLLDSVSKDELVKKITDTLIALKEDLSEDEYLYYKYYLEEELKRCGENNMDIKMVSEHMENMNLGDYDLGGVEITEKDFKTILSRIKDTGMPLEKVVHDYLIEIREVLDNGVEEDENKNDFIDEVQKDKMKDNVREWFIKNYPEDELGPEISSEITFGDVLEALKKEENVYELMGVADSFVREQIFDEMADRLGVRYGDIYSLWLDGASSNIRLCGGMSPKIVIEKPLDLDGKIANAKKDMPQIPLAEIEETRKLNEAIRNR